MKKIYILGFWNEHNNRPYIVKAYENHKDAIKAANELNEIWEKYERIYHIETIEYITK